ncbi:M28 family metallopeptidase [Alloacidobacterium sp.]|uniref:M28 family metallopeptidase n=1 Tax=Alloacidobacterium sp. TaxID=2951999 RepID=UPI002D342C7A|nr:M28 family metallopeptidase [Alloacidobacterium sp.]HYK36431.1 M28 family metallopeptidase [Alloacidobacterium sp.]
MNRSALVTSLCLSAFVISLPAQDSGTPKSVFGYRDFSAQAKIDQQFLAVPDAKLAGEELKTLTAAPHIAGSKEDHDTALYVADKFKAAGLDTSIVTYKAWLNLPKEIHVTATDASGKTLMTGPTPEHVAGDPFDDDPRVVMPFNGSSPSGDLTAEVVYANYGRPEDFKKLDDLGISVKGKIVITRYGGNFRGVKVYIAQQRGAAGVIIYSDPADDGYFRGDMYPKGPYRPETGVQRGAVQFLFKYPGDASTPGIASTSDLPESKRINPATAPNMPQIPATPISYHDAAPILEALGGQTVPHEWQGALPFTYHVGGSDSVKVHMVLKQDYAYRDIWDVIGKIPGTEWPDDWVVAGNHRDAWVYGAVDPNSGTAAMLETVHGVGELLKTGWKPKRTVIFASWDAEEEGLIGSTEWAEDNATALSKAVAYFNTDVGVAGPNFDASAVPSLKIFIRQVTKEVPSPKGGTVYDQWKKSQANGESRRHSADEHMGQPAHKDSDVEIGDLGSGSDYTPFIQHLGVPSTDIGSGGPYGVYHSVFDNYNWFIKNADPTFVYEQQQARVFGIEVLHMADTDVLPYDYVTYGKEITEYLNAAKKKADDAKVSGLDFAPALAAAQRFTTAAETVNKQQQAIPANPTELNTKLRQVEDDFLSSAGLPNRPWFKHTIYAPGEYTGYAAVVIPGVNEAIDAKDSTRAAAQLSTLTEAISRAASTLEAAGK